MNNKSRSIQTVQKTLSPNDLGLTGSHQAGILVPKNEEIISFFPRLFESTKNPFKLVSCFVVELDTYVELKFIHYNNKLLESGTRDEYRLTRMTRILRQLEANPGDQLKFSKDTAGQITLSLVPFSSDTSDQDGRENEYTLSGGWKITIKAG